MLVAWRFLAWEALAHGSIHAAHGLRIVFQGPAHFHEAALRLARHQAAGVLAHALDELRVHA
ncbi:hypothetical protein [Ralstonia mannitolilytica]|uniref:hypothetical protein n=1 Tax=Ralstonia mannitolilytica TaxID=105219 RepID=UPI00292D73DA|nr:hypothetical protein [Ralstonia mannitolilytica]